MSTTVKDIIDRTREQVLDDSETPYLWSDAELIHHLNRAFNELLKMAMPITDQTTSAITDIKLLSNVGVYALDSRVILVSKARLSVNTTFNPLIIDTEDNLNKTITDWRSKTGTPRRIIPGYASGYLSVYPKFDDTYEIIGSSDISFVASTKTISQPTGDFSVYEIGDSVYVSGTISNNGYKTVATVGTTSMTVSETVVNEANVSATIQKVEDTIIMTVNRLATARFTTADIAALTAITEVREDHLEGLPDGIGQRAFLKPDQYTYFPHKAAYHKKEFDDFKRLVKRDVILLHKPEHPRRPRPGTSIGY